MVNDVDLLNILFFTDYKEYVLKRVKSLPNQGRGEFRRIADAIGVSSVLVSQIFKGEKHITADQAFKLCQYFKLDSLQSEYFLLLVNYERSGDSGLRGFYQEKIEEYKNRSKNEDESTPHSFSNNAIHGWKKRAASGKDRLKEFEAFKNEDAEEVISHPFQGTWIGESRSVEIENELVKNSPLLFKEMTCKIEINSNLIVVCHAFDTKNQRFEMDALKWSQKDELYGFILKKNYNDMYFGAGAGYIKGNEISYSIASYNNKTKGVQEYKVNYLLEGNDDLTLNGCRIYNNILCNRWDITLKRQ
ncbi:MAG: hypothetical protein CL677_07795 [Bdellovibrionaceae bacterium]|nr:hypothetical protein [Pseudobdellovibrionaceae bacterium]|tara:strand:+ start:17628 stop:18536 length:909 start_codon:yes stop_codon:yes gene_type:complete